MKAAIESTDVVASLDGVEFRVWRARSERGTDFIMLVHRLQVPAHAAVEFECELAERGQPLPEAEADRLFRAAGVTL